MRHLLSMHHSLRAERHGWWCSVHFPFLLDLWSKPFGNVSYIQTGSSFFRQTTSGNIWIEISGCMVILLMGLSLLLFLFWMTWNPLNDKEEWEINNLSTTVCRCLLCNSSSFPRGWIQCSEETYSLNFLFKCFKLLAISP